MTEAKRGHAPESEEVQIRKIEQKWGLFGKIVENAFKWGAAAYGFWCIKEAWIASAGTTTVADLNAAIKFETITSWALPLGIVFGIRRCHLWPSPSVAST